MEKRKFLNHAYGTSKAALNYITLKIHFENPKRTAFPLDPGWVQTDMGNLGAQLLSLDEAKTPVINSVAGMTKMIDGATKRKISGEFMLYNGTEEAW